MGVISTFWNQIVTAATSRTLTVLAVSWWDSMILFLTLTILTAGNRRRLSWLQKVHKATAWTEEEPSHEEWEEPPCKPMCERL
ncbi:MAG: hypothetical protein HONDAALG_01515 [Gammaproteobacteria bacterium]|nr:hypothetical protein [Gammaproteobacteria bacterium]